MPIFQGIVALGQVVSDALMNIERHQQRVRSGPWARRDGTQRSVRLASGICTSPNNLANVLHICLAMPVSHEIGVTTSQIWKWSSRQRQQDKRSCRILTRAGLNGSRPVGIGMTTQAAQH